MMAKKHVAADRLIQAAKENTEQEGDGWRL